MVRWSGGPVGGAAAETEVDLSHRAAAAAAGVSQEKSLEAPLPTNPPIPTSTPEDHMSRPLQACLRNGTTC